MMSIQQSYKNRTEAFRKFIRPLNYPVGQSQFYGDFDDGYLGADGVRYTIPLQPDKSVLLADLVEYGVKKFNSAPGARQEKYDSEYEDELRKLKLRRERAETNAAERKDRKDDEKWMEKVDHEMQMAAFAGLLDEALKQHTTIKLSELIYLCGGDISRAAEFSKGVNDMHALAMAETVRSTVREVEFEEDESEEVE